MKKILPLVFALSISAVPALAWGWGGEGDCPFSKDKSNQEAKTEQVEESDKQILKIREGWLVNPGRAWAMRFYQNPHHPFPHVYVHRAFCKNLFLDGITPDVVIIESKNIPRPEAITLWAELLNEGWKKSKPLWLY